MNKELDEYMAGFNSKVKDMPYFITDNYIYSLLDQKLVGTGVKNIELPIEAYKPRPAAQPIVGRYAFKPSFGVPFQYSFDKYPDLQVLADNIVNDCANKHLLPEMRYQCVQNHAKGMFAGDYFLIDETTGQASPYTGSPIKIKIALCIPLKLPIPSVAIPPFT